MGLLLKIRRSFNYNERKAIEAACYLLKKSGGRKNYMSLLKLMYLADRQALEELGATISTDRHVSMKQGPVLSETYNCIKSIKASAKLAGPVERWATKSIELCSSAPDDYTVKLSQDVALPKDWELSDRERKILDAIHSKFGSFSPFELSKITHDLPEWKDPSESGKGATPIEPTEILEHVGKSADEIAAFKERQKVEEFLDTIC